DGESVNEPAADRLHVESGATCGTQLGLQNARGRRKQAIRRRRRDDDEIDVPRRNARRGEGRARRVHWEVARLLTGVCDTPLADPGTRAYPLVARINALREIRVGEDLCRQ